MGRYQASLTSSNLSCHCHLLKGPLCFVPRVPQLCVHHTLAIVVQYIEGQRSAGLEGFLCMEQSSVYSCSLVVLLALLLALHETTTVSFSRLCSFQLTASPASPSSEPHSLWAAKWKETCSSWENSSAKSSLFRSGKIAVCALTWHTGVSNLLHWTKQRLSLISPYQVQHGFSGGSCFLQTRPNDLLHHWLASIISDWKHWAPSRGIYFFNHCLWHQNLISIHFTCDVPVWSKCCHFKRNK